VSECTKRPAQDEQWQLAGVAFHRTGGNCTLVPAERVVEEAQTLIKTVAELGRNFRPGDRVAVLQLLAALHRFLQLAGPPSSLECYRPIFDLMAALEDLECGKVSPLVQPREIRVRPREPRRTRICKAMAAGLVDVLMATGASEQEALRDVADTLYQYGFPFPGRIEAANRRKITLDGWRRRVRENRTGRADVEVYRFTRSDNAPRAGELPEHARRRALFTLAGMLEGLGYRRKKGNKG
jgi:hypothetical protein